MSEQVTLTKSDVGVVDVKTLTATEKTPRLRALFDEAQAKRKPLAEQRDKLREELDALTQSQRVHDLRAELKKLNAELGPIDNEIAALAKALGGKSITAEAGEYIGGK